MNTKTLLLAVVFTSSIIHHPSSISFAQAPNWAWAKSAGGTANDEGYSVSTDAGGNVFITGSFESPAITFGTTTLTSAGGGDMFIVKYDAAGNVLWAKSAGGNSWDEGYSVSTDAGGNVFVTGSFSSPAITFGTTTLTNAGAGYRDMFIVKYGGSGTVLWAKSAGGTSWDYSYRISTDAGGNVFVTGWFYSPAITFGTTTLTNADNTGDSPDIFIVKYDGSGTVLWAKSAGGTSDDYGNSVSTDAGGNVFITGSFESPAITFGTTTLTNADNTGSIRDIFIVKYDAAGTVLWAKSAGGSYHDAGYSVSTDPAGSGDVFITGGFGSPSITFGTTTLTNAGGGMFIVKYDGSGTVLWAKSAGGTSYDYGFSVSTDAGGNVFVMGSFYSPSITFGTTALTNADNTGNTPDMFIVKYDASGTVLWAKSAGGTADDYGSSVSTDAGSNVFVAGYFLSPTITFGTTALTNANAGIADIFIAKLDSVLTGIESPLTTENEISIFPNPTGGKFVVQITNQYRFTDYELEIYNVYGEKVYSSIIHHPSTIIHLKAPSGIYFIRLTEDSKLIATKKLLITD